MSRLLDTVITFAWLAIVGWVLWLLVYQAWLPFSG